MMRKDNVQRIKRISIGRVPASPFLGESGVHALMPDLEEDTVQVQVAELRYH